MTKIPLKPQRVACINCGNLSLINARQGTHLTLMFCSNCATDSKPKKSELEKLSKLIESELKKLLPKQNVGKTKKPSASS